MSMSSYEVVRRAIEFETPDRLPLSFPSLGLNDYHAVRWAQIGTGDRALRETMDEWGCTWERSEVANMGQVKGHPLDDWSALARYRWPDPDDPAYYAKMEAQFAGSEGKYIRTSIFMLLFERMHALRGFENTLADLYLERERIEMLADRIVEFDLGIIAQHRRGAFPASVHGFTFTDDWGTRAGHLHQPAPVGRVLPAALHSASSTRPTLPGWHVWMHSCGKVNDIIERLIEIGLDGINLQQPRALGIEEIGRALRRAHLLRVALRHPAHAPVQGTGRDPRGSAPAPGALGDAAGRLRPVATTATARPSACRRKPSRSCSTPFWRRIGGRSAK